MSLNIQNLTKEYKRGGRIFSAVNNVNLSVNSGDFISIIGRSGSGKSTLLNLLAGLISPTSGEVLIDGKNINSCNDKELSAYRNEIIGYIPQGQSVLSNLTVLNNVRVPFYFAKRTGDSEEKAQKLLNQVGISHLSYSYPKHLSGGELKRVYIARALINNPKILLADEPTGDLDVQTTKEIMEIFRDISQSGTAVLMVTHEPDTLQYGNKTFVMDGGILQEKL
ncbi:MAG: ABC transporter ATP-binding protein [Ruminococcus sp.]|jgi:putative ABC transport system ATP-binding protein|nr:ABC transporter ATP-binding protein [Ruminococcus sp.]